MALFFILLLQNVQTYSFTGVKRPEREVDHSRPSIVSGYE